MHCYVVHYLFSSLHTNAFEKHKKIMYLSDICGKQNDTENCLMPILNADGIYMATYFGLLLNLKLLRCGYYDSEEKSLPISEVSAA